MDNTTLPATKRCPLCNRLLSLSAFGRDQSSSDGLQGRCKPCHSAAVIRSQKKHRVRHYAQMKRWRDQNAEKVREQGNRRSRKRRSSYEYKLAHALARDEKLTKAERHASRLAKDAMRVKLWMRAHPERTREMFRRGAIRRYERKVGTAGHASMADVRARWAYHGDRCWVCHGPAEATDHMIPLSRGGSDWPANLRPICRSCNSKKGARDWRTMVSTP